MRSAYHEGFRERQITTVIRPGDRSDPNDPRNNPPDIDLPVRFIKVPGDQARSIPAELFPDDGTTVRFTGCTVKPIKDLTPDDLRGCPPDARTPELVRYHLALTYNTPLPPPESLVTLFHFEYAKAPHGG